MAWNYNNLETFHSDVTRIAASVRAAQFQSAANEWRLGDIVPMTTLTEADLNMGYYKYQPQRRLLVHGDPTPATCESDPQEVDYSIGDPLAIKTHCWEKKYRVCHKNTCRESLEEAIANKEFAVGIALGEVQFSEFWYGYEELGTYGLFNHPLVNVSATPAPITPVSGETNFASKTANEIIAEIVSKMRGMRSPKLAISEAAWSAVADKILGTGDSCQRAGDCILAKLRQSESTGGFTGTVGTDVFIMKWLDNPQIGGVDSDGIYVVWDDDAVEFPVSDPMFLTPMIQKKRNDVIRGICTAGTVVKYSDSVCVVTGINAVIP